MLKEGFHKRRKPSFLFSPASGVKSFKIMNKVAVKVVKQNKIDGLTNPKAAGSPPKVETDIRRKMVGVVNNWISERRENRRAEKVFSDGRISAWKITPSS